MKRMMVAVVLLQASTAFAYDVEVNITGKIMGSTCTLSSDGARNVTFVMPVVATAALKTAGSVAAPSPLSLNLQDCPLSTVVKWENNANVDSATQALKNTAAGPKDLYVQVLNAQGEVIDLTNDSGYKLTSSTETVKYQLRYYTPTGIMQGGDFASQGYLTLNY